MSRLFAALRWDMTLQFRQGFYYVSATFILVWVALLSQVPDDRRIDIGLIVPAFIALNLIVTTFYFIGGLVMLEKGEGTLAALVVTPLRDVEYLIAKAVSLTLLAVLESLLIVVLVYRFHFRPLPLLLGAALLGGFYTLIGFVAIARYDSINEYLLPSGVIVAALLLPLLDYFGVWRSPILYLHPTMPALILMRAAFAPSNRWEIGYGVAGSLFWFGWSFVLARRTFYRFVVRAAGA